MVELKTRPPDSGTEEQPPERSRGRPRRSLWIFLGLLVGFVVYAYGFEVTEVSLDRIQDERRQGQLFRVLRDLARPDLLTYQAEETDVDLAYAVPCPPGGFQPDPVEGDVRFTVTPPCAEPREVVTARGEGLRPNDEAQIVFIPPSGVQLRLAEVRTDSNGSFETEIRIPSRPDEQVQTIRLLTTQPVGSIFDPEYVELETGEVVRSPRWSQNAIDTFRLIIETVFLALLATTWGTAVAVPLSFFAARNLMRDVRIPALQLGLAIVGIPVGVVLGLGASSGSEAVIGAVPGSMILLAALTAALGVVTLRLLPVAVPVPGANVTRGARITAGLAATITLLLAAQAVVRLALIFGDWAADRLGAFDFLGEFIVTSGEVLAAAFDVLAATAGAGVLAYIGSKLGYRSGRRIGAGLRGGLAVVAGAAAGALIAVAVGQAIAWLYRVVGVQATIVLPAIVGGVVGAAVAWWGLRQGQVSIGLAVYYVARTVFNTLRSIEALILVLVFVIWVGLGPFAGALALALHTVAANAKLYSEQVESINLGPIEAIRATGATRLQTVVYGVVPQIVAPYISFTMYRWDINVRMSTIIGFGGGGGIGFLLQQNIGLLNYRAAAAQMLAIAIVVATMDYISSRLRERFV